MLRFFEFVFHFLRRTPPAPEPSLRRTAQNFAAMFALFLSLWGLLVEFCF